MGTENRPNWLLGPEEPARELDAYGIPPIGDPTKPAPGPTVRDGLPKHLRMWTIFAYTDPRNPGVLCYVSSTCLTPERSLKAEYTSLRYMTELEITYPHPFKRWLDDLALDGLEPTIVELEKTEDRSRVEHHIAEARKQNPNLLNLSHDGCEKDEYQDWVYDQILADKAQSEA